jgi:hypothetical protein
MNPRALPVDTCERKPSRVDTRISKAIGAPYELSRIRDWEADGRGRRWPKKALGFFSTGSDPGMLRFFWFIQVGHSGEERIGARGQYQKERLLLEKTPWKLP